MAGAEQRGPTLRPRGSRPVPREVLAFEALRGGGRVLSQRKMMDKGAEGPARRPAAPGAGEGAGPGPRRKRAGGSAESRPPWGAQEPRGLRGDRSPLPSPAPWRQTGIECQHWRSWGRPDTGGGGRGPGTPKVSPQLPQAGPGGELGLMDRPNQEMGQMPQEEVRGQGSEVRGSTLY